MRRQQYFKKRRGGFTLMELIATLGVILLISSLILVGVQIVRHRSQLMKTKVAVKSIERALIQYFYEYGEWPEGISGYGMGDPEVNYTGIEANERVMRMLNGENVDGLNSRGIQFLAAPGKSLTTGYLDPWGNPYKFMCDFDDNGVVHIYFTSQNGEANLSGKGVGVWSRGADSSDEEPDQADDVRSW